MVCNNRNENRRQQARNKKTASVAPCFHVTMAAWYGFDHLSLLSVLFLSIFLLAYVASLPQRREMWFDINLDTRLSKDLGPQCSIVNYGRRTYTRSLARLKLFCQPKPETLPTSTDTTIERESKRSSTMLHIMFGFLSEDSGPLAFQRQKNCGWRNALRRLLGLVRYYLLVLFSFRVPFRMRWVNEEHSWRALRKRVFSSMRMCATGASKRTPYL